MYRSFKSTSFAMATCPAFPPQTVKDIKKKLGFTASRLQLSSSSANLEGFAVSSHLKKVMAEMAVMRR